MERSESCRPRRAGLTGKPAWAGILEALLFNMSLSPPYLSACPRSCLSMVENKNKKATKEKSIFKVFTYLLESIQMDEEV